MSEIRWQVTDAPAPEIVNAWDQLAIELGRPYCAPGWMRSWAEGEGGPGELRIGVASRGERVVGVVPLIGRPGARGAASYELLGSGIGYRVEPLAEPSEREAVAAATGAFLAGLDPPLGELRLHGIDAEHGWSGAIAAGWPGGAARVEREKTLTAPFLEFAGTATYESWLAEKSRHFRKRAWSDRRKLELHGELRISETAGELDDAVAKFADLHVGRWGGASRLAFPAMPERLALAAARLGPERMRAATAVVGAEVAAVDIFVRAGSVAAAWNGGWSERHRSLRPGFLALLAGVEDAIESGVAEVDLGPGAHPWKERLATRESTVVTDRLVLA